MTNTRSTLHAALTVALARAGMTQTELALGAGWPPSTLSSWLRGVGTPPADFVERLEQQLRIPRGSLSHFAANNTERA